MATANLVFQHNGQTIGEARSTYVPDDGWTVTLESVLIGWEPGLYRVVGRPHGVFSGRGLHAPASMVSGPVFVHVVPVTVPTRTPGVSSQTENV